MKEEFLHFIWKNQLFGTDELYTRDGCPLEIIDPGAYNRDSGPDFFNSRIRLGETEWAGNVEIHINASDWYRHKHNIDHAYDNVILHVVANYDSHVKSAGGIDPPACIITWEPGVEDKYREYLNNPDVIACRNDLHNIPPFSIRHWISRMATERLDNKTGKIVQILKETNNDWDETLYRLLSRYFGMKVNSEPFFLLSRKLPLRIIRKHADNRLQVEALMFGQAGMLEPGVFEKEIYDEYYCSLLAEYKVLRQKYSLKPSGPWIWKFHRLRPFNFPTIRISQLAGLMSRGSSLFSIVKSSTSFEELHRLFACDASDYWNNHYIFGSYKKGKTKRTGNTMISLLLINTVIPMLFLYGRETGSMEYCNRAVDLLDNIEPEDNRIIREWSNAGIIPCSALESQGLIHLREEYCKNRQCLNCQYGSKLISLGRVIDPHKNFSLEEPGK